MSRDTDGLHESRRARPALRMIAGFAIALLAVALFAVNAGGDTSVAPDRPQAQADRVVPAPSKASKDKGRMYADGCQAAAGHVTSKRCVYGKPRSKTTVVLTGDSHALMYFPALHRLANRRGWRLVALTKVGCPPFDQLVYNRRVGRGYRECLRWHRYLLKRLQKGKPDMVITSSFIWHKAMVRGNVLPRASQRNRRLLRDGYVSFLKRTRRLTGAQVVLLKDPPKASYRIPECVGRSMRRLRRCAFRIKPGHDRQSFERGVVRRVGRAKLVDLAPVWCPQRLCHAVINDRIVYRDGNHLTATYAGALWRQLRARLPLP